MQLRCKSSVLSSYEISFSVLEMVNIIGLLPDFLSCFGKKEKVCVCFPTSQSVTPKCTTIVKEGNGKAREKNVRITLLFFWSVSLHHSEKKLPKSLIFASDIDF